MSQRIIPAKPPQTTDSWWASAPREAFTENASRRFVGCSVQSHKKPRAVYMNTEDAIKYRRRPGQE